MPSYRRPQTEPQDPYRAQPLPITRPVAVYYRQSSEAQIGNISTTLQTVDMVEHLVRLGWQPEQVIMIDMDAGISGMKTIQERPGMSQLYAMIEEQKIGAVAAQDVDRFFRDLTQIQTNLFIDACRRNNVLVLTPTMVYDFDHAAQGRYHMQMFREQAQRAADYLEFHIKGRLVKSRSWRKERGFWTGRWIALGYMVDLRKTLPDGTPNPSLRKYAPLEPYAEVIRTYFELFREHDGSIAHTWQHIEKHGPFFPDYADNMVPDGFKFRSRMEYRSNITGKHCPGPNSLKSFLTNVVYIGHWVHRAAIVQWHNHPAIVPLDVFMYAFNRLSPTDFYGDANPDFKPYRPFRRMPKHERNTPYPTYAGLVFSDDLPQRNHQRLATIWCADTKHYNYQLRENQQRTDVWRIRTYAVDPIIDAMLLERLQATTLDERLWQDALTEVRGGNMDEIQRLEKAIQQAKKEQINIVASLSQISNEEMIQRAEHSFEQTGFRISKLERELEAARTAKRHEKIILQSRPALEKIAQHWPQVPRHERRNLFEAFAEHIRMKRLGRYNKELTVCWRDGTETTGFVRTHNKFGDYWSKHELEDLRQRIESNQPQVEILQAFPGYTWRQLVQKYAYHFTPDRRYTGIYAGEKPYPNVTRWEDTREYQMHLSQNPVNESSSVQRRFSSTNSLVQSVA